MKYRMIEKRGDVNTKLYTVEELKNYFSPLDTDGTQLVSDDLLEDWKNIQNINDLEDYLAAEADGMEVAYAFEETPWYAVKYNDNDDLDYGSFDLDEAKEMAKNEGSSTIYIIDDDDSFCLGKYSYDSEHECWEEIR